MLGYYHVQQVYFNILFFIIQVNMLTMLSVYNKVFFNAY